LTIDGYLRVQSASVSFGKRLKWPDDYFSLSYSAAFTQYKFKNYGNGGLNQLGIDNTTSNNFNISATVSRNSLDDFTFPTRGSSINFIITATPPYSAFNHKDYSTLTDAQRYKFVEFHKWMWDNSWFTTLVPGKKRNLVLNTRAHFGFIGGYTAAAGVGPFERFIMGGSGLSGFNYLLGSDYIGLRGYQNQEIVPQKPGGTVTEGGTLFNKFVAEVRYPVNMSPALSIIAVTFLEAGNTWNNFKDYNPFNLYRSAGVGVRVMMPAFGMIGIDWGYRLDNVPGKDPTKNRTNVTFVIGQQIR
jgi:outer membrane protein insertion porin family